MQNVSLLRANIEDAYDGNSENRALATLLTGASTTSAFCPSASPASARAERHRPPSGVPSPLRPATIPSTYTISFSGLSKDICLHLRRFQYRSWAKVEAGGTAV